MNERDSDSRRGLRCPSCSTRITIPGGTAGGTRARCGACGQLFRVPAPPGDDQEKTRSSTTKVQVLSVDDMPEALRRELHRRRDTYPGLAPPIEPATHDPRRLDDEEATRRAFDLDHRGDPRRRSGVQHVDVAELLKALGEGSDPD